MIKIAICDNDRSELEKTSRLVAAYFENRKSDFNDFNIDIFGDSSELSDYMRRSGSFDLLILDTSLRGMSGIELASEMRERGEDSEIVFVSQSEEFAYDAYKVNAIQYLLKPIQKAELHSALSRALTQIANSSPGYTVFKTSDGIRRVGWNEIVNSYTMGHYQLISLTDGSELKLRATSDELYSTLKESGYFMRVGSPYIINITHLKELQAHELTLDNGARIPLPKNSYKLIKNEFFEMEKNLKRR